MLLVVLAGYEPKDIYSCDETTVFFKVLPNRTYNFKGKKCVGTSKQRVTALLCCSADGSEKRTPLIIGQLKNPRCFKNIKYLPCTYKQSAKAWMTTTIFATYLRQGMPCCVQRTEKYSCYWTAALHIVLISTKSLQTWRRTCPYKT